MEREIETKKLSIVLSIIGLVKRLGDLEGVAHSTLRERKQAGREQDRSRPDYLEFIRIPVVSDAYRVG
jgi:hypothetical protein